MIDLLIDPFELGFMQRALLASLAVGLVAPITGFWAVQRRLVYLTDAMSHAILAGVAGAALLATSLVLGAFVAAFLMALAVSWLVVRTTVAEDAAVGVVGQGLFAAGVIGVSLQSDPRSLSHVLFGNPLTVTWTELALQWGLVAVILVGALALDGLLSATTFDPAHARTVGVRVGLVDAALLIGLSLTIVVGLLAVGVLMSLTLAIAPAAGARLLSDSRPRIMAIAVAFGLTAAFGGLLLSYYVSVPTGPLVALVAVAQFACCAVVRRTRRGTRQVLSVPAEAVA